MKLRYLFVVGVCMALLLPWGANGGIAPQQILLPNYDRRLPPPAPQELPDAQQRSAAAVLEAVVPEARVSNDPVLGTPNHILAKRGYLTGPGGHGKAVSRGILEAVPPDDPHRVIKAFVNQHAALFGHDATVFTNACVERDYVTPHSGIRTVIWRQILDEIPVFEGVFIAHMTREEELISVSSMFVPEPDSAANRGTPARRVLIRKPLVSAAMAVKIAAGNVGLQLDESEISPIEVWDDGKRSQAFTGAKLRDKALAKLVWFPIAKDQLRLCWQVTIWPANQVGRYRILIDVQTGEVLLRHCLTRTQTPVRFNVFTSDSPSPFSPGWSAPYLGQPPYTTRNMVELVAMSTNGSPAGWVEEGQNPVTRGNNAIAFLDVNLDALPDVPLPVGAGRVFNFPLDLNQAPITYADASVVQLFYDANWYHDKLYDLGFTETAGNYQHSNFGRGGRERDRIICLAQAEVNNAFFYPTEDGDPAYCVMGIFTGPTPDRDSALDQEVVFHELTHGVSERVVGGGLALNRLQPGGLGEGWSDFYPLCLLSEPTDDPDGCYACGGYSSYLFFGYNFANYYFGIRRYPYSTDMTKNPLTFKDIDPTQADPHYGIPISPLGGGSADEVHNQGEVWCSVLHEMWAELVKKWGWGYGNYLALRLATDGMKLTPPEPTFLQARDAILKADEVLTGGENYAELWRAFAKRGMGYRAQCPPSYTTVGVVESFDVPPDVFPSIPDGILEVRITPLSGATVISGRRQAIYVRVTDGEPVRNATVIGQIDGSPLTFKNDGVPPDLWADDATYTAEILVPSGATNVALTIRVEAPGKVPSTNAVGYVVIPPPINDHFTNAIKVPAGGARYLTDNSLATLEVGEPLHGNVPSVAGSLWWNYTASTRTNVLLDTGGSDIWTVLAVYTNNVLTNLSPVAYAVGATHRKGAYLYLDVNPNVTYRIVVAGYDDGNRGTIRFSLLPGARPDTNPPVLTITAPPSGLTVFTDQLVLTGMTTDSGEDPSGIRAIWIAVVPRGGMPATNRVYPPSGAWQGPVSSNWIASVVLQPGLNTIYAYAEDFAGNRSERASIEITYRVVEPQNDFFVNALELAGHSGIARVNTLNATKEVGEPNHAGNLGGKSVWWKFVAPADGKLELTTSNSTFDTVLAVYSGESVGTLQEIASNDDAYPGAPGGFSRLVLGVRSNAVYRIALDGYDGAAGCAYLSHNFTEMPVCTVSATPAGNGTVSISVENGAFALPVTVPVGTKVVFTAAPGPHTEFDSWEGDYASLVNPLVVTVNADLCVTARFRPVPCTDDFEAGGFGKLPWVTSGVTVGDAPWLVQTNHVYAGMFSARSGVITNYQRSSLVLTGDFNQGMGAFWYKVSSEPLYDTLSFWVDGTRLLEASGERDWTHFAFPLTAGPHALEWRYAKDAAGASGLDAAFIDNVVLPIKVAPDRFAPAKLVARQTADGVFYIDVSGQTNQWYVIECSQDLAAWIPVSTNVALNGFFRYVEYGSPTNRTRFYRAVVRMQ